MRTYMLALIIFITSTILALAEELPQATAAASSMAVISGQVMIKQGIPMINGVVLLYNKEMGPPPHPYKYWRIPDIINGTDNNGKFSVEVPEGVYYLMIAQKKPDGEIGPPRNKEFLYFHSDANGDPKPIIVTDGKESKLGKLTKSFLWSPKKVPHDKEITAVEGTVVNMNSVPIEKAIVFAYYSKEATGRPAFVSDKTDKNGKYQLRVYEGGIYYLKTRSVIGGGAPEAGEYQSVTKEFVPVEVSLTKGQKLKNVVLKVDIFSGKGSTGTVKTDKIWKNTGKLQAK